MPSFIANADYEEKDSDPIRLEPGDEITVGPVDRAWPGWVWAEDDSNNDGYVPEEILEPLGEGHDIGRFVDSAASLKAARPGKD